MIKKIERVFIIVILLVFCLKAFLHWSVSPLLIILLSIFSLFSAVMGLVLFTAIPNLSQKSLSTIKQWRIPVAIFLGIAASTIITGFEFKIMLWQGASQLLIMGSAILLVGLLLSASFLILKKDTSFKSMFVRCASWFCFALFFLLLPDNTLIDVYYHRFPDYARALKNYEAHPNDSSAINEWEFERAKLDSLSMEKR